MSAIHDLIKQIDDPRLRERLITTNPLLDDLFATVAK